MKPNPAIIIALIRQNFIPQPVPEYKFCETRRWRFDYAWPASLVALEVQGGIWGGGRHTQGPALLKEWEKLNTAAVMGWRILYCQPKDLCTKAMLETIKAALSK